LKGKNLKFFAGVVELVDTLDLKSNGHQNVRAGSSPAAGTLNSCRSIDYRFTGVFSFLVFLDWKIFRGNIGTT
jgi:hypothetical protein